MRERKRKLLPFAGLLGAVAAAWILVESLEPAPRPAPERSRGAETAPPAAPAEGALVALPGTASRATPPREVRPPASAGSSGPQDPPEGRAAARPAEPAATDSGSGDRPAPGGPALAHDTGMGTEPDPEDGPMPPLAADPFEPLEPLDERHPEVQYVMAVQNRYTAFLMAHEEVVGTATGLSDDGRVVVMALTKAGVDLPGQLDGVPVVVWETGEIYADGEGQTAEPLAKPNRLDPTARFQRPVPIGVSTGHPDITAGTIGCRVTDGTSVYALSNNHIYADENQAIILVDNALQPGPADGGVDPDDAIGKLWDFVTIDFTGAPNQVDAAIALCSTLTLDNATPSGGYGTPKSTTLGAALSMKVKKFGRTTKLTNGVVSGLNATVTVNYGAAGNAGFTGQILISNSKGIFSKGGDSGSLIVASGGPNDNKPVGLLFAGTNSITIANPIDTVLRAFGGLTVDGQ